MARQGRLMLRFLTDLPIELLPKCYLQVAEDNGMIIALREYNSRAVKAINFC